MAERPTHVLVIDDSAVVRQTVTAVLQSQGDISVAVAADPVIALDRIERRRPDVIILDLEMPRMDGLTFLRKLMNENPIPVIICSGHVEKGSASAFRALEDGAVDLIAKPQIGIQGFLYESAVLLIDAVRAAAAANPQRHRRPVARLSQRIGPAGPRLVAIGASTGGTEAIHTILAALPQHMCGIAVVQHMPEMFTKMFARRLDDTCAMRVKEAEDGDRICEGLALIAPGNRHMVIRNANGTLIADLVDGPLRSRHRPSVDVLFQSVAEAAGDAAVGVILTGMGRDGAEGLLSMRGAGAATIAQDAATSVVFGMAKEAIALGAAEEILPLDEIPKALMTRTRTIA
ncbi:MAG TPA: chemotaxis response regulator protein-glutamate methylesterase [Thermoanaerobaculia bacterium]|nr:chemotaxis response regulator protein-glutamate methylesterase [Thermoanaerobaculia bacterium]